MIHLPQTRKGEAYLISQSKHTLLPLLQSKTPEHFRLSKLKTKWKLLLGIIAESPPDSQCRPLRVVAFISLSALSASLLKAETKIKPESPKAVIALRTRLLNLASNLVPCLPFSPHHHRHHRNRSHRNRNQEAMLLYRSPVTCRTDLNKT